MPISARVDADRRLVVCTASGVIEPNELQDNRDAVIQDPRFDPSFNRFFDVREVTGVAGGSEMVFRYSIDGIYTADSRGALLAQGDWLFGLARMYGSLTAPRHGGGLRIFRDLEPALAWLGVDSL